MEGRMDGGGMGWRNRQMKGGMERGMDGWMDGWMVATKQDPQNVSI
jgi:hypothetical protein